MDKKYIYTHVAFTEEQAKIIEKVIATVKSQQGIELSRSQAVTLAAHYYLNDQKVAKP